MQIHENFDLSAVNTFGIPALAEKYTEISQLSELEELLESNKNTPIFPLGGGSNILLTRNIEGLVIKNNIRGIEIEKEDDDVIYLRIGGGEVWHSIVEFCLMKGWGGIENLSLIPGSVGAAPIQNIGAYGVELKDVLYEVEAFHLKDHYLKTFTNDECDFGYRNSIFKRHLKGQFFILNVTLRLSKNPSLHLSYGSIGHELEQAGVRNPNIRDVSRAVIRLRQSKLPDPKVLGNAGSFFKNPVIAESQFETLKIHFPEVPHYPQGEMVKIPAAWLIEQCGFKGFKENNIGCYEKQPLVIVNYGNSSGKDIFDFSQRIIDKVFDRFNIRLEREVNVY